MNYDYCHGMTHVIKAGDTLYSLSRSYQVPLGLLLRANPYIDIYNLQLGDEICIPCSMRPMQNRPGNGGRRPPGNLPPCSMMPGNAEEDAEKDLLIRYVVRPSDTVGKILDQFGLSLADLLESTPKEEMYLLPGSSLKIKKEAED